MTTRAFRVFEVSAGGRTVLDAWQSVAEPEQPVVLLCPGLGSRPEGHPELLRSDSTARLLGWVPRDPAGAGWAEQVGHARAVLDAGGVSSCSVVGWSSGTAVAVELARQDPQRVRGVLLLAGTPGPMAVGLPEPVSRTLARGAVLSLGAAAPLLSAVEVLCPADRLAGCRGVPSAIAPALRGLLGHDWRWTLAAALTLAATGPPVPVRLDCPVTLVAGRYDVFSEVRVAARAVSAMPQARVRIVPTSHFVPWEAPAAVAEELDLLLRRVAAVEQARLGLDPTTPVVARPRGQASEIVPSRSIPYPPWGHPAAPFNSRGLR